MPSDCTIRVGTGFDLHKLVPNLPLLLGGVAIPFHLGLEGHSDGDVLIHAVIDALLGAANLGDIGLMFPPNDESIRNMSSATMVEQVMVRLDDGSFEIVNLDAVVICEEPKLSGYYPEIRANLGRLLRCGAARVSVKAKTAEGLGEIGRGEAIAAQCVALIAHA